MRMLYVDNYRGFSATWIPIADVNFLVGDNSTGKTSILSLINVLGSFEFWFYQQFNNAEVELGAFKEIVSAGRPEADSFSIGVIECPDGEAFPSEAQCTFLMTFAQRAGMPRLKEWSFVVRDKEIRVSYGRGAPRYAIEQITPDKDASSALLRTFRAWLREPAADKRGYQRLSQSEAPFYRPIYVAEALRARATEGTKPHDFGVVAYPGPAFANDLTWIGPVRSKPARMYGGVTPRYSPEGAHTPHAIRRILSGKQTAEQFHDFVGDFGQESHLFEKVYVRSFGKSLASPFEVGVVLDGARLAISDVGYGVSQSLPILVEMVSRHRQRHHWHAVQQPEVHLHPRAQAALGDFLVNVAVEHEQRFLIETHSDYLIDRFRLGLHHIENPAISCQVLYFERRGEGNCVQTVPIMDDGNYAEEQPEGFRSFFIHEQLRLLEL